MHFDVNVVLILLVDILDKLHHINLENITEFWEYIAYKMAPIRVNSQFKTDTLFKISPLVKQAEYSFPALLDFHE